MAVSRLVGEVTLGNCFAGTEADSSEAVKNLAAVMPVRWGTAASGICGQHGCSLEFSEILTGVRSSSKSPAMEATATRS